MSLISRLRAVVAGDDYLDGELDDFAYDDEQDDQDQRALQADGGALATIGDSNPFDLGGDLPGSNVIGMPGISNAVSEVNVMEPRSFDEMPAQVQIDQLLLLRQSLLHAAFPEITLTKLRHGTHGRG